MFVNATNFSSEDFTYSEYIKACNQYSSVIHNYICCLRQISSKIMYAIMSQPPCNEIFSTYQLYKVKILMNHIDKLVLKHKELYIKIFFGLYKISINEEIYTEIKKNICILEQISKSSTCFPDDFKKIVDAEEFINNTDKIIVKYIS